MTQVIPTHINRNPHLFEQGLEWAAAGGSVEVTVGPDPAPDDPSVRPEDAIARFTGAGLPLTRMMASSDSNGSLPVFDANGRLVRRTIATERDFSRKLTEIIKKKILPIVTAVRSFRPPRLISTSSERRAGSSPGVTPTSSFSTPTSA